MYQKFYREMTARVYITYSIVCLYDNNLFIFQKFKDLNFLVKNYGDATKTRHFNGKSYQLGCAAFQAPPHIQDAVHFCSQMFSGWPSANWVNKETPSHLHIKKSFPLNNVSVVTGEKLCFICFGLFRVNTGHEYPDVTNTTLELTNALLDKLLSLENLLAQLERASSVL